MLEPTPRSRRPISAEAGTGFGTQAATGRIVAAAGLVCLGLSTTPGSYACDSSLVRVIRRLVPLSNASLAPEGNLRVNGQWDLPSGGRMPLTAFQLVSGVTLFRWWLV